MEVCEVWRLPALPFEPAQALQRRLSALRAAAPPDRLLLLSHPPTYTLGSSGSREHLLLTPDELARRGIALATADRGGDITYHGPGQLVGYPILGLAGSGDLRADVLGYVRGLEQAIIQALAAYGVAGRTIPGCAGVWVDRPAGPAKICAIGVRVTARLVTRHGFALNLNTNLRDYEGIIPCGIRDKGVTSLAALLGAPVDEDEAARRVTAAFGAVFNRRMVVGPASAVPPHGLPPT